MGFVWRLKMAFPTGNVPTHIKSEVFKKLNYAWKFKHCSIVNIVVCGFPVSLLSLTSRYCGT